MPEDLTDRIALVTGAGRGLGQRVALGLAARGAKVVAVARSPEQVAQTQSLVEQAGGTCLALAADVGQLADVENLARQIERKFRTPLSILVNAAGVFGPIQLVRDSDPQEWIGTIVTNTIGPYLTCRQFVGPMIDAGWGRIINFSSAAAFHTPGPLNSAYGTSKVALNHFTRHLAAELAGTGVTANVIHPGEVKTEMWATIRDTAESLGPIAEGYRKWAADVGRSGGDDPQKAVDLVLRLVDDAQTSGQFLWIEEGIQRPILSW